MEQSTDMENTLQISPSSLLDQSLSLDQSSMSMDQSDNSLQLSLLNVNLGRSSNPDQANRQANNSTELDELPPPPAPKRRRRTQDEMDVFRAEQEQARLCRKQEREMAKLIKNQEKEAQKQAREAEKQAKEAGKRKEADKRRKTRSGSRSTRLSGSEDADYRGKQFVHSDFENICSYLENTEHYTDLYGDGSKTGVGMTKMTKSQAFDVFAVWMNNTNPDLLLNGRRLQLRIDRYKKKYLEAKWFEENTGAGIESSEGPQTLAEALEKICPCFDRIDAILQDKANVVAMLEFDHSQPGLELPPIDEESDESQEGDLPTGQQLETVTSSINRLEETATSEAPDRLGLGRDPTQESSTDEFTDSLPNSTPLSLSIPLGTATRDPSTHSVQGEPPRSANNSSTQPTTPTPSCANAGGRQSARGRQTPLGRCAQLASISASSPSNPPQQAPKVSLATAFSSSADSRFAIIERQIEWKVKPSEARESGEKVDRMHKVLKSLLRGIRASTDAGDHGRLRNGGSGYTAEGLQGAGSTEGQKRGSERTRGGSGGGRPAQERPEEYLDRQTSEG
ncbi:uncharacterized protein PGTG_08473 [Puccinia graminis f. sp. tritici CRL 75-36-700-3]|uniref:Uncharacterized protein n=1 Tax=Puccinia graminis f. sp. tritici (strain CRL 75-36-700-3 / race SCCL) TaxID=418459 RepID=E3KDT2_PUCGT|nr:uncharacterized protein PGTG_08473 [Puccinia graminis f. sp. tritici CRL 75-36-700-3]EFP82517.1 hypothetical protein PGTG_08473 [Puccinia graminis f. sp. tritici CRL 75-36-700-3]